MLSRSPAGAACPRRPLVPPTLRSSRLPAPVAPAAPAPPVDADAAEDFVRRLHAERPELGPVHRRLMQVFREIAETGTYVHTATELEHGARVAWRNSARCIGRLYWRSLRVRDRRRVTGAKAIADECVQHLHAATNLGRIRPVMTVFAPAAPGHDGPRIWNDQLVRYAAYDDGDQVVGDPSQRAMTEAARLLGWEGGSGTAFDVLPLVVETEHEGPRMVELPEDAVLEVAIRHPELEWFRELELWWHAVPAISSMPLEIGGVLYPAAPFNGWYMGTEIGARNFADADRYDLLPVVAERMGLDTSSDRSLWRDRALLELNVAVVHSFDAAGVTLTDHHTESQRFLTHLAKEEAAGRSCPADWSWIVPPMSGGITPVFHRYYDDEQESPQLLQRAPLDVVARARAARAIG